MDNNEWQTNDLTDEYEELQAIELESLTDFRQALQSTTESNTESLKAKIKFTLNVLKYAGNSRFGL